MSDFHVSTDSTCDLFADEIKEFNIHHVPLCYTIDTGKKLEEFYDDFQNQEEYVEYFNLLRKGYTAKTSMLNLASHIEHFTKMAKAKIKNAIHFTISYSLSPTVDVANKALEIVKQDYPDFNVMCVQSHTTTIGQGILVKIAVYMRDKGKTLQETYDYVQKVKHNIQHFIVVDNLMFLRRGGRIGTARAAVGSILNLKPILTFTKEGKLEMLKKEMGMKKSIRSIVSEFGKYTLNKTYDTVYIVHTDNLPMASLLEKMLIEKYNVKTEIRIMGPIIGAHVGPGSVAYGFVSNEERPI